MLACVERWRLPGSRSRAQLHFRRKIQRKYVHVRLDVAIAVVGVVVVDSEVLEQWARSVEPSGHQGENPRTEWLEPPRKGQGSSDYFRRAMVLSPCRAVAFRQFCGEQRLLLELLERGRMRF